ncbi:Bsr7316 protein [Halorhodospira halochloris]|uniref:Bsr7316 protein n=1 Tax=Halorhodospira halochloris TaxID=1052 RepID=A0A0X8XBV3_HALHR|nr:MrpF/PhaF family protein [Halorhodospira halochloris]MBK1652770.1 pH regulation protein F [Halorhodospira halochloris]BAU58892.1 Bsr7316 protein [Halorhodospira halochloris]
MENIYTGLALFLLLNLLAGLFRVYHGPSAADRMLAALLFGTTTVAVLLLLAQTMQEPALRDVALLFTLLAAVIAIAFTRLPRRSVGRSER